MFSMLKYLYYGKNIKLSNNLDDSNDLDDDPIIIDSYIDQSIEHSTIKPVKPIIKKLAVNVNSQFNNHQFNKNPLTERILKKLNADVVYLVLKKNTGEPLGIYNTLAKAKEHGQKSTYHNCSILEYKINDPCKYIKTPVFENN